MKTPSLLIALLLTFFVSITQLAVALTPRGRPLTGTIQKVDTQSQEVEMLREDKGTVITFVWVPRHTTFVANGQMADVAILKKGARVQVSHHVPFFGKPFVTRVTLLPTPASSIKPVTKTK